MPSPLPPAAWGIAITVIYKRRWAVNRTFAPMLMSRKILDAADKYIAERAPEITRFEASCTSDIVGIDHLTHTLKRAIEHFGKSEHGRLRFVTKFHHVDHLLDAEHNGKTRFRFSVNADYVIKYFESGT